MSLVKEIMQARPADDATNEERTKYNEKLYEAMILGDESQKKEALEELVTVNQPLLGKLATKLAYAKFGASLEDAISIMNHSFLETMLSGMFFSWNTNVIDTVFSNAKRMLYDENKSGGISGRGYSAFCHKKEEVASKVSFEESCFDDLNSSSVEDDLRKQQIMTELSKSLSSLSPKERAILMAIHVSNMKMPEIAEKMECSYDSIRKAHQRILKKLRKIIDPQAFDLIAS